MTTPSSQTHLLPLLLLAATLVAMAATADQQQPSTAAPVTLPGCPDKCGAVSIPYPFGMKDGCFLPGFQVVCNETFDPPRAFLSADNPISVDKDKNTRPLMVVRDLYYSSIQIQLNQTSHEINVSRSPVELIDISVSQGQARVYGAFSFDCSSNETYHSQRIQSICFPYTTPFLLSEGNTLTVIGRKVEAEMPIGINVFRHVRTAGRCFGKGWCQEKIDSNTRCTKMEIKRQNNADWRTSPCSYGMVVDKSWYNFSLQDLEGDSFLQRNVARGVPVVLDFTVRSGLCPAAGQPEPEGYACASGNSSCVNGTIYPGHHCMCSDGYQGNPYIPNGCQDIDECERPDLYPCHGKCENRPGGYDCTCPVGTRGANAKEGPCTEIFTLPAKVSIGAIGGLFVIALLVFLILLRKEKRKMSEFFKKNGGPTLENTKSIKIYKKEELKPILKTSNFIGKGGFGEVYKGLLDNQLVAVKKPIGNNASQNEQFANEVIIQSQVIHKNIVRLIGCCLEVDIPMLVYEFLSKGSLDEILHGSSRVPLDLHRRLNIAAESAEGLAYMHSKTTSKILHGDVKPANILLDDNFAPKISDFGISRLIATDKQHTKFVIGDMSYMDPVYLQTGLLSDKSDVYSFGVVLLELISRKKAMYSDNNSLVMNFLDAHKKQKRATELFDKEIAAPNDLELLDSILAIAVECLNVDVDQRPEMTDVAERLLMLKRSWYK